MRAGIILYGPPAAGKDTVTQALHRADPRYSLFKRLKVGGGRTEGYRVISKTELADLADRGEIVWENRRYGAVYAVDRSGLSTHSDSGVPVLHLGQSAAVDAVKDAERSIVWLVVYLWCARDIAEQRMHGRNTGDVPARLSAWDSTESIEADLRIDTGVTDPDRAAGEILLAMGKRYARN
ncbi:kinase [Micromonospora sp. NPDC049047]|uniref:kinase n=1 Tax=Micromonospora sp. NPDC049047 TaxID=3155645 RepID=UPI0033E1B620